MGGCNRPLLGLRQLRFATALVVRGSSAWEAAGGPRLLSKLSMALVSGWRPSAANRLAEAAVLLAKSRAPAMSAALSAKTSLSFTAETYCHASWQLQMMQCRVLRLV